jgi:hypothetical protein
VKTVADIYNTNFKGSRSGSEIIGEGRNPKKQPTTNVVKKEKKSPSGQKSGVHLKRGEYNS